MLTHQQPIENRQGRSMPAVNDNTLHIADELEAVVNQIQDFLQNFCDRFETLSAQASILSVDFAEDHDYATSRDDWEDKRLQAEQRIREQVDLLTQAWLRLEDEQRSLLQTKQALANELKARSTTFDVSPASILQCLPGNSQFASKTEHAAVHEFKQLRHEIQSSRPNIKS